MDALKDFEYKHNNRVTVKTSFGKIELIFKHRDTEHAQSPFALLVDEWLEDDTYPAHNERTYFDAVLIDGITDRVICMGAGVVAEQAIQDVIQRHVANKIYWETQEL